MYNERITTQNISIEIDVARIGVSQSRMLEECEECLHDKYTNDETEMFWVEMLTTVSHNNVDHPCTFLSPSTHILLTM